MTNEELAEDIKNGNTEQRGMLWGQVRRFTVHMANQYINQQSGSSCKGLTVEDLVNTGFIAMCKACETYNPEKSSFINWYAYYLKSAFAFEGGHRTTKRDILNMADSLDKPIDGADPDGATIADIIPSSEMGFQAVEDGLYYAEVHKALDKFIEAALLPLEAYIIRAIYWDGLTKRQVSEQLQREELHTSKRESDILHKLRRAAGTTPEGRECYKLWAEENARYTPIYGRVGIGEFNSSHSSIAEKITLERERLREERKRIALEQAHQRAQAAAAAEKDLQEWRASRKKYKKPDKT